MRLETDIKNVTEMGRECVFVCVCVCVCENRISEQMTEQASADPVRESTTEPAGLTFKHPLCP